MEEEGGEKGKKTPEEALESDYQVLKATLAQDLLDQVGKCSPSRFEQIVVDLLVRMGNGGSNKDAGEAVGGSGDEGIDGIIRFLDDGGRLARRAVVQVKSGAVHVKDIRELSDVAASEAMGIFITLEPPTREMVAKALSAGAYHSPLWDKDYPKIQILTIDELLQGKVPDIPPPTPPFPQAARISRAEGEQLAMGNQT